MYIKAILSSAGVLASYFLLIVGLSALILGNTVKDENIFKRFMIYLMFGNLYISSIVFVLGYFKGLNRASLIISLILLSSSIWLFLNRKDIKEKMIKGLALLKKIVLGAYGVRLFLWRLGKKTMRRSKAFFKEIFQERKVESILVLLIIAYNIYQYGINGIEFFTYMSPDEEVHLYWIQSLIGGEIFPAGVYPHIFHNVLAAIAVLFGMNALIVLKYIGPTLTGLIMIMLYFGLRKIFTWQYPALFGLMIYSVMNLYAEQATYRFQFAIPQEYAMIMLMPMVVFLFDYIEEKKILDLIFFGVSLSLMLGIHFYTAIIAMGLIVSTGLIYLYKIIRDKLFLKLLLCGVLSLAAALMPLGVGLTLGYEMEQSMDWATDVIKRDIYTSEEPKALTRDGFVQDARQDLSKHVVQDINILYIFMAIMLITLIFNLFLIILKRGDPKSTYQIIFVVNSMLLIFLMLLRSLQLPTIMETKRLAIFFAYFSPFLIGMPLEIIGRLLRPFQIKKTLAIMSLGAMTAALLLIIKFNYLRPLPRFYYFQTVGTMKTNMRIMEDYQDYSWTAVSPVNNISGVLNHGFHYELDEFIVKQENWNKNQKLTIPTEYVFIYIDKRPITDYGDRFYRNELKLMSRQLVSKEDALKNLTINREENKHYKKERPILMAKAYYWAQEYMKFFPKEMDIYYEDPELIVYRIKQNKYALNNFSIDYGINSR